MLRDRRSVSACSISSCRIRAEALARAFNTRLWPCSWMPLRSASGEGMSNGLEEDEEFFEASPSPERTGEENLFCQHKSADTEAGREKLYQLLQHHAIDDAIDVFYDVSEEAGLIDGSNNGEEMTGVTQPLREPCKCGTVVVEKPVSQNFDSCIHNLNLNGLFISGDCGKDESSDESCFGMQSGNQSHAECQDQNVILTDETSDAEWQDQNVILTNETSDAECQEQNVILTDETGDAGCQDQIIILTDETSDAECQEQNVILKDETGDAEYQDQNVILTNETSDAECQEQNVILTDETSDAGCQDQNVILTDETGDAGCQDQNVILTDETSDAGCQDQNVILTDETSDAGCQDQNVIFTDGTSDAGDLQTNCEIMHDLIGPVEFIACDSAAENSCETECKNQRQHKEDENPSVSEGNTALTSQLDGKIPNTDCASHCESTLHDVKHEDNAGNRNLNETAFVQVIPLSNDAGEIVSENSLVVADMEDTNDADSLDQEIFQGSNDETISIEVMGASSPSPSSDTKSPTSDRLQVFEEFRPLISRSTSLKTGKTPPGTPSRKKFVRFADALGLDLEDVRHIMSSDVPSIPSSAYTDLNLKDVGMQSYIQASETVEIRSRFMPGWSTFQGISTTIGLHPSFAIPGEQPDFFDRVRIQGVCLETMLVSDMCIQCTCRVMNYGFHKKVTVRYTVNDWCSVNDVDAAYVQGSSQDGMDRFRFNIFLSACNRSVQFAIRYSVNGNEFWDNNRGQNYCLSYHGHVDNPQMPGMSWTHQFW